MSLDNPSAGYNHIGQYQVSGLPWVTSSVVSGIARFDFGYVSRTITVKNFSGAGNISVAFSLSGSTTNYFLLSSGQSMSEELRAQSIYVSGSGNTVSIVAGLTMIPSRHVPALTASNGLTGVG